MHCCLPSGTNKIGELMNCPEKRRKLTKNVPLARIVPFQEVRTKNFPFWFQTQIKKEEVSFLIFLE